MYAAYVFKFEIKGIVCPKNNISKYAILNPLCCIERLKLSFLSAVEGKSYKGKYIVIFGAQFKGVIAICSIVAVSNFCNALSAQ